MTTNNILSSFTGAVSSKDLIHESTQVVDLSFNTRNKDYILKRIQFWKEFIIQHQLSSIMVMQHTTIDSIAIIFACAEEGVSIQTSEITKSSFELNSQTVDMVFLGLTYAPWVLNSNDTVDDALKDKKLFFLDEKNIDQLFAKKIYEYTPKIIDLNKILICGSTSGTTGPNKQIKHTNRTFIQATKMAGHLFVPGDTFVSHSGVNHIGFLAVTMISPMLVGTKLFTINHFHEILVLATRGIFTKIALYESNLIHFDKIFETIGIHRNCLKNTVVLTAGGPVSTKFMDRVFITMGAKEIISFYGCNETLAPFFVLHIPDNNFDIYKAGIGEPVPHMDYKIKDSNLWIKSPSLSSFVNVDKDGYYNTTDIVADCGGTIHYLGRGKILTTIGEIFGGELKKQLQYSLVDDLYFSEYFLECQLENNVNKIVLYALTNVAYDILNKSLGNMNKHITEFFNGGAVEFSIIDARDYYTSNAIGGKINPNAVKGNR